MTNSNVDGYFRDDMPHDPSDFGRCFRLLELLPEWKERMQEVADKYKMWGPMVARWKEMTELHKLEVQNEDGRAPKLYALMQKLRDEGRVADGWTRTSERNWKCP